MSAGRIRLSHAIDRAAAGRFASVFAAVFAIWIQAETAFAVVPILNGIDPGPCGITVYWDESWTGCEEVQPHTERGRLMAAAGENAVSVMRAWRRKNPDLIVPLAPDSSTAVGTLAARRREFGATLRREMAHTFAVDSMAVTLASDSIGTADALLRTRYWLARSLREGRGPITRQIGWVDYLESWAKVGERWALVDLQEVGELAWEPGADVSGSNIFPSRPGEKVAVDPIEDRAARSRREMKAAFDAEWGPPPDRTDAGPVPLTTVQPRYPEFAREAQIQGKVILRVLVTVDGTVADVYPVKRVTGLNEAAMDAVKRWTFIPAVDAAGNPVEAWTDVPIDFHL